MLKLYGEVLVAHVLQRRLKRVDIDLQGGVAGGRRSALDISGGQDIKGGGALWQERTTARTLNRMLRWQPSLPATLA